MSDDSLIDQIVSHVMEHLRAGETTARSDNQTKASSNNAAVVSDAVITAEVLEKQMKGSERIQIGAKSVLTPSAQDFLRSRKIEWSRSSSGSKNESAGSKLRWRAWVVAATPNFDSALADAKRSSQAHWEQQLSGCWRESVDAAVGAVCRAEIAGAVVVSRESASAACRANRNSRIRAAVASSVGEVRTIQNAMSANVYCVDPTEKSMFELRNIMKELANVVPHVPNGWKD